MPEKVVNMSYVLVYRYLVNFLLDSTVGLLLIFILLKLVSKAVRYYDITPLISGVYGELVCSVSIVITSDVTLA